ncbi:MAG: DUF3108 domain-containing protein [Acidobacteriota bacterium]|nr:DUF3108 domain-containing protein [Acidobacteriota bacterium]
MRFPYPEKLTYQVEWRLINAGTATVQLLRGNNAKSWEFDVHLESAGLVSRLYRIADSYKARTNEHFCLGDAALDSQEGKKHSISKFSVNVSRKKLSFEERDLVKNTSEKKEINVAICTSEIVGALASLRTLNLEPGKSIMIPIADGKKFAQARVESQAKEKVTEAGKNYDATRYEAFLFDNVLYKRRGRLLIWISNDADHLPVQFRLLMGFPIGTVTVWLQKQEK